MTAVAASGLLTFLGGFAMVGGSLALARLCWRQPETVRWYFVARFAALAVLGVGVIIEVWSKDVGATVSSFAFVALVAMSVARLPFIMRARRRRIAAERGSRSHDDEIVS